MAVAALITGIVSIFCCGLIVGPVGAILGLVSRGRIARSGGAVGGGTMATLGMVFGIIGFVLWVIFVVVYFVIIAAAARSSSG